MPNLLISMHIYIPIHIMHIWKPQYPGLNTHTCISNTISLYLIVKKYYFLNFKLHPIRYKYIANLKPFVKKNQELRSHIRGGGTPGPWFFFFFFFWKHQEGAAFFVTSRSYFQTLQKKKNVLNLFLLTMKYRSLMK